MNRLAAVTYLVRDYDEAIGWFQSALGFSLREDVDLGGGKRWVKVAAATESALLLAKADGPDQVAQIGRAAGGRVAFFLYTEDFSMMHSHMAAAGVRFLEQPRHEAYGIVAVFVDLYGNKWDLIEPNPSTTSIHEMKK